MGVPTSEVSYTSATTGRGDHEVHKGNVVALGGGKNINRLLSHKIMTIPLVILRKFRVSDQYRPYEKRPHWCCRYLGTFQWNLLPPSSGYLRMDAECVISVGKCLEVCMTFRRRNRNSSKSPVSNDGRKC
jgi:hypothetical protein